VIGGSAATTSPAVADLAGQVRALYAGLQPPDADPMLDLDERDLLRAAEQAGYTEIHLELRVDIEPQVAPRGVPNEEPSS
jgi:hypothetical protein